MASANWQPLAAESDGVATLARPGQGSIAESDPCRRHSSDGSAPVYVAAFLAGPVRSLLTPSVHRTIQHLFWDRVGGQRVLFARLFDVHALEPSRRRRLMCVLRTMSRGGAGEWSAPTASGKTFLANGSALSRCRFSPGTQLQQYPYMVQSLERQLDTLRACYDRMVAYESERRLRFRWILRTRTDGAFLLPARPFCELREDSIYHARNFSKGPGVHHMFADHSAVVPRALAPSMFVGVAARLASCATNAEHLPAAFATPEAFIHHALLDMRVGSASAAWLAPIVVSVDGRMQKWCGRYGKLLGVKEVLALGATPAECANALLTHRGRWVQVAGRGLTPSRLRDELLSDEGCPPDSAGARTTTTPDSPCTWANGCCARHPRMSTCVRRVVAGG